MVKKKRKPQAVRTTVCVPADVKERMNAFERRHFVNWSAVFAAAVEAYMRKHSEDKET